MVDNVIENIHCRVIFSFVLQKKQVVHNIRVQCTLKVNQIKSSSGRKDQRALLLTCQLMATGGVVVQ